MVINAATGEPLKKVYITLQPLGPGDHSGSARVAVTDNAGHFLIDDVEPGQYMSNVLRNGFVSLAQAPALTLANGQSLKDLVFKLAPQAVITGHVADEDGDPLAGALVQVNLAHRRGRHPPISAAVTTNDLGEFRLFGLRPGKYVLNARYQAPYVVRAGEHPETAEEGYPTLYYPNALSPDAATPIEVAAGAQIHGIDMKLVRIRTLHIRGHVIGIAKAQNRTLMLWPRDSAVSTRPNVVPIDENGAFEMHGVVPGAYFLFGDYVQDGHRYIARTNVDVGNSNIDGLEIAYQPAAEIKGRVVVEENGAVKGARMSVRLDPKSVHPTSSASGGAVKEDLTFRLSNIAPDAYDVNVVGLPGSFYVRSVRVGDQDITDTGADFTAGVPPGEMTIVINPNGGRIEGTVENAKTENAAGATITLIPDAPHRSNPWLYRTSSSDRNGRFTINGVRPGDYTIYAWDNIETGDWLDPDVFKPHESEGQAVSIKESDRQTVQLKLISGANQ